MEFNEFISNVCNGLPFKKGDFVLLNFLGEDCDLHVLNLLCEELCKKGIIPHKHQLSLNYLTSISNNLSQSSVNYPRDYFDFLSSFKYVIDIFMESPRLPKELTEAGGAYFKDYMKNLFQALSTNKEYYIQLRVPTEANAASEGIDYNTYKASICDALAIDFTNLRDCCNSKIETLRNKGSIEVLTGTDSVLNLSIENRSWYKDDGSGDFPPGEVYIAPLENSSEGELFIETLYFEGTKYNGVLMEFKEGKLINCSLTLLMDFINSLPREFRVLCEFGIGLNPGVKKLIGCNVVDEKAIGTYHIALGMNNLFGGLNSCPFHMDFVFTAKDVIFS